MKYLPGKTNPCDFNSQQPVSLEEQDKTTGQMHPIQTEDTYVNKTIIDNLPDAVTVEMIQRATKKGETMQALINSIKKGYIDNTINLKLHKPIFHELTYTNRIVLGENQIIIPPPELASGQGNLQQLVIDLAHEGHQGEIKCKNYFTTNSGFHTWIP